MAASIRVLRQAFIFAKYIIISHFLYKQHAIWRKYLFPSNSMVVIDKFRYNLLIFRKQRCLPSEWR